MTKKFWNDWQKRIGETKAILGYHTWTTCTGIEKKRVCGSLTNYWDFKIISAKFNGDNVDLVLEIMTYTGTGHYHKENKYISLNRNEISTIIFIK